MSRLAPIAKPIDASARRVPGQGGSRSVAAMRFRVDAILFDIDGTLVDSTAAVIRTWTTWAAKHGIDADEVLRVCHGRRTEDTLGMFLPAEELARRRPRANSGSWRTWTR